MKKWILLMVGFVGLGFISCERNDIPEPENQDTEVVKFTSRVIEGRYVVVFEDAGLLKAASLGGEVGPEAVLQTARDVFQLMELPLQEPEFVYSSALRGIAVEMTAAEAEKLAQAKGVKGVWPDLWVTLGQPAAMGKPAPAPPAETIPPGITRVGGGATFTGSAKAWIIDTGIDLDHPDLNVDTSLDYNYVANTAVADDDNGHGTHCAGIVAAKDNTIGVVGVAAGAKVVPVKVLNKRGSGTMSAIIAGVNYVASKAVTGDAANLSLGGGIYDPLDAAVIALGGKGVKVSLAAGNESQNAANTSPAGANGTNVYTISAMDKYDVWASFSNFGNPPVDFCAPGVSIYSTYKGGGYATMSGTSMAAPHVCGILLWGTIKTDGFVTNDPDGTPDPIAHK